MIWHKWTALVLLLLVALLSGTDEVRAEGFAGKAGAFLRMGNGAAAVGTGDTGVARGMGAEQGFYNPAGLPYAPANDVYMTYHALSLDRRLAHVSALYQVPGIDFWQHPMIPLALVPAENPADPARLVDPDELIRPAGRTLKVEEYLPALAKAILMQAERPGLENPEHEPVYLYIDDQPVRPGPLLEVVDSLLVVTRELMLETETSVIRTIEERYRDTREKPAAVAVSWTHAGTDEIEGRDLNGNLYGMLGYFENRFALSFGIKLAETLSLGVTAGVLYALVPDMLEEETKAITSTTFGADVGLQFRPFRTQPDMPWRLETLALGVAAYDLGAKNTWNTSGYWDQGTTRTDNYPSRYRAGLAYSPARALWGYLDLETDLEELLRPKLGAEALVYGPGGLFGVEESGGFVPALILRGGMDRDRPTFGLGLELDVAGLGQTRLDYAYVLEPVSPEATQIVSWRFQFVL